MVPEIILAKAEFSAFLKQYAVYRVYRNNSRFNLGMESIRLSIEDDRDFCRFIYIKEQQVGGVILRENSIKHIFLYPGYEDYLTGVIKALHEKIFDERDPTKGLSCLPSDSLQAVAFSKLGYKTIRKLRCMMGPVNKTGWNLPRGYSFRKPMPGDADLITECFYKANIEEPWHQPVTIEHFKWGTDLYFNASKTRRIPKASTLCFKTSTGVVTGACLVSFEEGYPFIFDLHVLKEHRRKGIAIAMMKKALNALSEEHEFMRLFVIDGNPASKLYEKLGFIAGNPVYVMKYSHESDS